MTRKTIPALPTLAALLALGVVPAAQAANECPPAYDSASCNGVCAPVTAGNIYDLECDLETSAQDADATMLRAVTGYKADTLSVWGTDDAGDTFCCHYDEATYEFNTVVIDGTSTVDDISLNVTIGGTDYNLRPLGTDGPTPIVGVVFAKGGADDVHGSDSANCADHLYGDGGNDTLDAGDGSASLVFGGDGADVLYGGDGVDWLSGEGGIDELYGGAGDDYLVGGDHADSLFGGAGEDLLKGDGGNDALHGGDDPDTLIGGPGDDELHGDGGTGNILEGNGGSDVLCANTSGSTGDDLDGGADSDTLWGASTDTFDCGGAYDYVSTFASSPTACEDTISTAPAECL